ncbi:MAG TPA: hypothetical protein VGF87_02475 [Acidimicrobiales bacterium]
MDSQPPPPEPPDSGFSSYRGARVEANSQRVAHVAVGLLLVALAALSVGFFIAGAHHNAQIDRLKANGVRVQATVTTCVGQLGGSGSNVAGYTCTAAFSLRGQHDVETLPGNTYYRQGTHLSAVAVPGDPALVAPLSQFKADHSSGGVYVLPVVFLAAFVVLLAVTVRWRKVSKAKASG